MKKLLLCVMCVLFTLAAMAEVKTIYINPLQNDANLNGVVAKRLYKKGLLGLTKAKTIAPSSGQTYLKPGTAEASKYDYILTMTIDKVTVEEANTVGNLLGMLSSDKNKEKDFNGKIYVNISILDPQTGHEVFKTTLTPNATNKDKELAVFNATNHFDYDMTDLTDDAFRISGEILESTEVNKKNIVKKVRANIGSKDGARKGQTFEVFKVENGNETLLGAAKCEQVLNATESILSINGSKDQEKNLSELIINNDGEQDYKIKVISRSSTGFLHNNFQGMDKFFAKEERPDYLDPFGRIIKPRVAFLAVEINDREFSSQQKNFEAEVLKGMEDVTTVELVKTIYPDIESARRDGIDGLMEISIDKVFNDTEKKSDGKIEYKTEISYTVAGYDVANNRWINMKSMTHIGTSKDGRNKSNADALTLIDDDIRHFAEDIFPVSATIVNAVETKKDEVKTAIINVGTNLGVKKGMTFDIYEQRKEGGADSRFLLGEGKVEGKDLGPNEAVIKVKGKNDGDKRLYTLLTKADEDTEIILVSKANYGLLDKGIFGSGN